MMTTRGWQDPTHRAYLLLRIAFGLSIFVHGAARLWSGPGQFVAATVKQLAETPLPTSLVTAFAWTIPGAEAILGALLLVGLFTNAALIGVVVYMCCFIFATGLRQNWQSVHFQLLYAVLASLMMAFIDRNTLSLDGWRGKA